MQMYYSLRCKLLAENTESLGMSFLYTSKVESGHFGSCGSLLWKYYYLKLWEVWILLLRWCIGHNSAAGEVRELLQVKVKKWHRVYSGLLVVARSFFSWLKNLMAFLSLSLLVESKVSLRQPVSVLYCFMYTLKSWRCSCLWFKIIILYFKIISLLQAKNSYCLIVSFRCSSHYFSFLFYPARPEWAFLHK